MGYQRLPCRWQRDRIVYTSVSAPGCIMTKHRVFYKKIKNKNETVSESVKDLERWVPSEVVPVFRDVKAVL